jgi:hypothetical protein
VFAGVVAVAEHARRSPSRLEHMAHLGGSTDRSAQACSQQSHGASQRRDPHGSAAPGDPHQVFVVAMASRRGCARTAAIRIPSLPSGFCRSLYLKVPFKFNYVFEKLIQKDSLTGHSRIDSLREATEFNLPPMVD